MNPQFSLLDETFFGRVHEFDGIFDGEKVTFSGVVNEIDHGCQGGRFSATGRTGYQNESLFMFAEFLEDGR